MLVSLRKWATHTGTQLKLMNLMPRVVSILKLTNLRSVFEVCSVQEMLELLCRATEQSRLAVDAAGMDISGQTPLSAPIFSNAADQERCRFRPSSFDV
jgi:hypothetical protein